MKSLVFRTLLFLLFLLVGIPEAFSQEQPVQIQRSRNKVLLSGKVYYIHAVQKGETLYSLCRVYNITETELRKENPDLEQGLKEGMVLKIPEKPVVQEKTLPGDTSVYVFHIVNKGETLFSLAKFYGITVEQIAEYNPEVKYSALQINQVLKIPKSLLKTSRKTTENAPATQGRQIDSVRYIVGQGETLYSLSRRWNNTPSDIILANGGTIWRGLKAGDTIIIPQRKTYYQPSGNADTTFRPARPDTAGFAVYSPISTIPDTCYCDSSSLPVSRLPLSVYLFLPLNIDRGLAEISDTASDYKSVGAGFQFPIPTESLLKNGWYEFYLGFLLGAEQMRNKGYSVKITTDDLGKAPVITGPMLSSIESAKPDMVISPVNENRLNTLGSFCSIHQFPLVTPTFPEGYTEAQPFRLLSFEPPRQVLLENFARWFREQGKSSLIIIHPADSLSSIAVGKIANLLPEKQLIEAVQNDTAIATFEHCLDRKDTNFVLILSEKEEYVGEILRTMVLLARTYPFIVIGSPSWNNFFSIDAAYFHQLNLCFFTPFFFDYKRNEVRDFLNRFRNTFGFYPVKTNNRGMHFALLGYDMACILIPQASRYRNHLQDCFETYHTGLLGDYHFGRDAGCAGYTKKSLYLVRYLKDFSVVSSLRR